MLDVVPQVVQVTSIHSETSEDSNPLNTGSTLAGESERAIEAEAFQVENGPQSSTQEGHTIDTPLINPPIPTSAPEPLQDPKAIVPRSGEDFMHRKYMRTGRMVPGSARTAR